MTEVDRLYPYDASLPMAQIRLYKGPDRLRWVPDRALAQTLLDIWQHIEKRDARKRSQNVRHWNETEAEHGP